MKILLFESNPDDAASIRTALKACGLDAPEVTWAERLPAALARLADTPFDVLLVDLAVPGGRGLEVVAQLAGEAAGTPIVVLADLQNEATALEALARGAQDHLLKPQLLLDHSLLGRALRYAVERQRREDDLARQRHEADVLAAVARSVNSTFDLDRILGQVVEWSRELTGAELGAIAVAEPDGARAVVRHVAGRGAEAWAGRAIARDDRKWGGGALHSGRPEACRAASDEGAVARLAVPIVSQDGVEGLLCSETRGAAGFSDHDELMLLRLADAAAIAMRNARLFAREQGARAAAEASEARVRLLFANAPVPMWVADAATLGFLAVNDAAIAHYGHSEAEFLRLRAPDLRATEAGEGGLERHRTRDGRLIDVEVATHPFRFDGRDAIFVIAQDVTVRRRAEEALRESAEQLRQLERLEAAARLAGSVAHELTDLVTVIQGHARLALDAARADEAMAKHLEAIQAAALRTATLQARLLAFGQRQPLDPVRVDLAAMVLDMDAVVRQLVGPHIRVSIHTGRDAGPVRVDRGQLERVLVSLVVNARDAMPEGGHLMIEVMPTTVDERFVARHADVVPGAYVLLAVSDTGHGMSPEVRARVFEPLFTTRGGDDERGWGLAMVHGIVRQSGGEVLVYSEVGHGTTVKIYLPRASEDAPGARPPGAAVSTGDETVLLVEDETQVRQLAVELLEGFGYRVLEARFPEEALAIGERHAGPIDLLLSDIVMPGLTGPELARRLAARRPEMKILFMSGYTDVALASHGVPVGSERVLEKPFTAEGLAARVRAALDEPRPAP